MLQISRMQELSENADSEMNDLKERSVERNLIFLQLSCVCVCIVVYVCLCVSVSVYVCVSVCVS